MINARPTDRQPYLAAFEALEGSGWRGDPAWVRELRRQAIARFDELGFPTARRGNEEWKYTDVGPIAREPFGLVLAADELEVTSEELAHHEPAEADWPRLVYVDGRYAPGLSRAASLPPGVTAMNLKEAMATDGALVEQNLARHAVWEGSVFTALNTAFVQDGAFVHIGRDVALLQPLHLLFLSTARAEGRVAHPRVLVVAEAGSHATLIETYGGLWEGRGSLTNAVTELVVGESATVEHYRVQRQGPSAFHIATAHAALARDSSLTSVALDVGGGLARNNLTVLMDGEGSTCTLNGLYLVSGSQHVDNQVIIDHAKPRTTSRELYKGILDGRSRAVFHGSIVVRRDAQQVDAQQSDKNLLLSDEAEADTRPAFWIYADDVKCGHGAACGQLDQDALFYLQSRGIGEEEARALMVNGFVAEVVESIPHQGVRTHVSRLVSATLGAPERGRG